ncbi:arabinan endo-1,5-alpha-L-arabinosidase [Aspergillus affinis]|uniref:arabinan endo-1,5-alpha-L-arabinosidase n=1 Tax=Aspergillus affinis TaxID=1070780 RepID=UPI0022FEAD6C|nr:putative arabinan endo-1 [Aspergillus affinis]KAI9043887.1 putative arabinan endo-1 [Aspergillus affinis]
MALLLGLFTLITLAVHRRSELFLQNPALSPGVAPPVPAEPFAPAHGTDLQIHDPSILKVGEIYYSYSVGENIAIHQAPCLDGPWKRTMTVLDKESIIPKGDRQAPWAPMTIEVDGTFYCYYAVSFAGCRDSAIGVATSKSPGPGGWTDHGSIVQSGTGPGSANYPYNVSNAIDPCVFITDTGQGYLTWGSYWTGLWQVPLSKDLLSVATGEESDARHLAYEPRAIFPGRKKPTPLCGDPTGAHPVEGGFISYHAPYHYLWFSWGKCCKYDPDNLPAPGKEYQIRVGRSLSPRGPFVDRIGRDLVDGGGEVVYGSNRDVYAPGGEGVLTDDGKDILYYHYLNTTISYDFWEARLGYNPLEYIDGWPVAV